MRHFFLSIVIAILSISASASTQTNSFITEYENGNILIEIELGDMTNMSKTELYKKIDTAIAEQMPSIDSVNSNEELNCSVKVTGSVGVGNNKIAVEITVSGPCSEVEKEAKRMLNEIKKEVKELI